MTRLEGKVSWEKSWDRALARAREEHKPVFLDFFKKG